MFLKYVACSTVVNEAVWLRKFFQHLRVTTLADDAGKIYSDNMTTLAYVKGAK